MAFGVGTTTSDAAMGPGYPTLGSFAVAVQTITATTTNGMPVTQPAPNSPNVPGSKVGG